MKDKPKRPTSSARLVFEVYPDNRQQWRWRLWASNGKIIGDSGEGNGYVRRRDAVAMVNLIMGIGVGVTVEMLVWPI